MNKNRNSVSTVAQPGTADAIVRTSKVSNLSVKFDQISLIDLIPKVYKRPFSNLTLHYTIL